MRASCLLLLLALLPPELAAEVPLVPLRAFSANYDVYMGNTDIADARLSLQPENKFWRWSMTTTARGFYALFIRKNPSSETSFSQSDGAIRLQQILISDSADKDSLESASFDWDKGRIEVLRKGKQKHLPLAADVYDYHSIHLLAAAMQVQKLQKVLIDYYRKGKLVKASVVYSGEGELMLNGKNIKVNIYEQTILKSASRMKVYYDTEHPVLPLQIEKLEPDKKPVVMILRSVDWSL